MAKVIRGTFPRAPQEKSKSEKEKAPRYQFLISLTYSDPPIWRRFQVPGEFRLTQFHRIIDVLMGWSGVEAHQFYIGKIFYEMAPREGCEKDRRFDESKYTLYDVEEAMKWCFLYLYDAGEGWEHEIELEEIISPTEGEAYPVLLAGERSAPPEEFDGIHEYEHYVTGLAGPEIMGDILPALKGMKGFDPLYLDVEGINKRFKGMTPGSE